MKEEIIQWERKGWWEHRRRFWCVENCPATRGATHKGGWASSSMCPMLRSMLASRVVENKSTLTYPALCPYQESCCLPWEVPLWLRGPICQWLRERQRESAHWPQRAQPPEKDIWDTRGLSPPSWVLHRYKHTSVTAKDHMGTRRDASVLQTCCQGNNYLWFLATGSFRTCCQRN